MNAQNPPEQRQAPRFRTAIDAQITAPGKLQARGLIANISSSGLQIECPMALAAQLMPNVSKTTSQGSTYLELDFEVKTPTNDRAPIHLTCSIIYVRRKTLETYQLGCQFHEFSGRSGEDLQAFLQHFAIRETQPAYRVAPLAETHRPNQT